MINRSYNGYRAAAFLGVFFFHTDYLSGGYLGVQAFFVLSGFLLTPKLLALKTDKTFIGYYKHFLGKRALRILPLYLMYLLGLTCIILLFQLDKISPTFRAFIAQLPYAFTFTYNIYHRLDSFQHIEFLSHFWSLAVEEQFYLVWPLLIYFVPYHLLRKTLSFIIYMAPLIRLFWGIAIDYHWIPFFSSDQDAGVYFALSSHIDAFATGALCSVFIQQRPSAVVLGLALLGTMAIGWFSNYVSVGDIGWDSLGYLPFMYNSYKYIWGYTLVNLCMGGVLLAMREHCFLPALFEHPIMNTLGQISYGLYVYHYGLLWVALYFLGDTPHLAVGICLIGTVLTSLISYHWVEKWFLGLKKNTPAN